MVHSYVLGRIIRQTHAGQGLQQVDAGHAGNVCVLPVGAQRPLAAYTRLLSEPARALRPQGTLCEALMQNRVVRGRT